jgi:hypothetical protein
MDNATSLSLSDLSHDSLWRETAEDNRDVRAELGVYRGTLSFAVFDNKKGGAPVFKFSISRKFGAISRTFFEHLKKEPPGSSITFQILDRDEQTKKMNTTGSVTYGIDKNNTPYVGVLFSDQKYKFTMRPPFNIDYSTSTIPPQVIKDGLINTFLDVISIDAVMATRLSNQKRSQTMGGNRNFNRSASSGRGNYGDRPQSDYNAPSQTESPAQGSKHDLDDAIPF